VWAVRLVALVNPLLAYFLGKRISGPVAGLISAALVSLFGYYVTNTFSLDTVLLTFYLLALLTPEGQFRSFELMNPGAFKAPGTGCSPCTPPLLPQRRQSGEKATEWEKSSPGGDDACVLLASRT
jgi:hypothetical protein